MAGDWNASRILLLQGPVGPFFTRLAEELTSEGRTVFQVRFNGGDALFRRGEHVIDYRGKLADWPTFFGRLVEAERIEAIVLFGDMRPVHRAVIPCAEARGMAVYVFEEGYFRPNFVTLERDGVNANSRLPRDPEIYRRAYETLPAPPEARQVGPSFSKMGRLATANALGVTLGFLLYPYYRHHRPLNAWVHAYQWVRGFLRKHWFLRTERALHARFAGDLARRYFFLPLQVHADAQLQHSDFPSMEAFIETQIAGFAAHADPSLHLVIKHHPMDRAYREYGRMLRRLAERHGLVGRLHYVHDADLDVILANALGTITMNSTVGLQSLECGTPTLVVGRALYDIDGLTFRGDLAEFLRDPGTVDRPLFEGFKRYVVHHTQANGNFYRELVPLSADDQAIGRSGVIWPKAFEARSRSSGVSTPRSGA